MSDAVSRKAILEFLHALYEVNKLSQAGYAIDHVIKKLESGRFDIPSPEEGRYKEALTKIKNANIAFFSDHYEMVRGLMKIAKEALSPNLREAVIFDSVVAAQCECNDDEIIILQPDLSRDQLISWLEEGECSHADTLALYDQLQLSLKQNEQQQAENRTLKDKVNQLRGDRDNWKEECEEYRLQLQQYREENERLKEENQALADKFNETVYGLEADNERLRVELERYEERRQTAALEVGKLVIEHDQVKAERDDYRKVLEWYGGYRFDDGQKARDIIARYEKGE